VGIALHSLWALVLMSPITKIARQDNPDSHILVKNTDLEALMALAIREINRHITQYESNLRSYEDGSLMEIHPQPQKVVDQAIREIKIHKEWLKLALLIADVVE
jgi:hypothetical protein